MNYNLWLIVTRLIAAIPLPEIAKLVFRGAKAAIFWWSMPQLDLYVLARLAKGGVAVHVQPQSIKGTACIVPVQADGVRWHLSLEQLQQLGSSIARLTSAGLLIAIPSDGGATTITWTYKGRAWGRVIQFLRPPEIDPRLLCIATIEDELRRMRGFD